MKYFSFIILLCFLLGCSPKLKQSLSTYSSSDEFLHTYDEYISAKETKVATWYHYVKTIHESGYYIMRYFYPETKQITYLKTYKTRACLHLHGPYKAWWENGNKRSEGAFLNDKKEGEWIFYGWKTGTKTSKGEYYRGEKIGDWKFYDKNEKLTEDRTYVEGLAEGDFVVYDTLGNVFKKGLYKVDTIFSEEFISEKSIDDVVEEYVIVDEMPIFPEGEAKMLEYIYTNINYPTNAREYGVEGLCVMLFVVNEDGSITDVESKIGICESMEKECLRVIKSMPDWEPGTQKGKPVRVSYYLPIRFKLQ